MALGWAAWRRRRGNDASGLLVVGGLWLTIRLGLLVVALPGACGDWLAAALDMAGLVLLAWPFLAPPLPVRWADRLAGIGLAAVALACGVALWQWVRAALGLPSSPFQPAITWAHSALSLAWLAAINLPRHPARRRIWLLTAAGALLAGAGGLLIPLPAPLSLTSLSTAIAAALTAAWLNWLEHLQREVTPLTPGSKEVPGSQGAGRLLEASTALFAASDPTQLLKAVMAALTYTLEISGIALLLIEDGENNSPLRLRLAARWPQADNLGTLSPFPLESIPVLADALTQGQAANVTGEPEGLESLARILRTKTQAMLILPLLPSPPQGGARGVLILGHDSVLLDDRQLQLCRVLADQVAIAIRYIQLRTNARQQSQSLARMISRQKQETGQLHTILESIADGVIVSDANDQVILTNSAALRILIVERPDVLGQPFGQILGCMVPAGEIDIVGTLTEASSYGMEAVFEVSDQIVQMSIAPVEDSGGAQMGVVAVLRDITALARAEAERERLLADLQEHSRQLGEAADQLREMDQLKSQFIANVSHELYTPLNAIIGFAGVMLKEIDGPLTGMQREDLEAILTGGKHLLGLITDILDISQIWSGKMDLTLSDVDMAGMIEDAITIAIPLIGEKPIELVRAIDPDLPVVQADEKRTRQVLINLLTNAIKYTEHGQVTVAASRDDGRVIVSVSDTGIGIPPEHQEAVFEEFGRVDNSSTRKVRGLGLGLSISRRLVELHSGQIWVESKAGVGSTFSFSLPIAGPRDKKITRQRLEAALAKWQ